MQRRGFTLMELLVTITIIALLATVLIVSLRYSLTSARIASTRSTVKIADSVLQSRLDAFRRSRWADPLILETLDILPRADGKGGVEWVQAELVVPSWCDNDELRALFVTKYIYSRAFPQTWTEVADWMGPEAGVQPPAPINPATEPSEVLLFLLTQAPATFHIDAEAFNASQTRDTDGNGRRELIDAWGNPIVWYRWPTRLVRPDGWPNGSRVVPTINSTDLARARVLLGTIAADVDMDPDDPKRVADPLLQTCIAPPDFEDFFHTPRTYFRGLIVSPGPDGLLGLNASNDKTMSRGYWANPIGNNDLLDNVTNGN